MAYFARVEEGIVIDVLAVHDNDEYRGNEFLSQDLGLGGVWIKTSYNTYGNVHLLGGTPLRYNFAALGYTYNPNIGTDGAFIPPSPYPSWILNEETCQWKAPIEKPSTEGVFYNWDESILDWVEVTLPEEQ